MRRYAGLVRGVALRLGGRSVAEDVEQTVFTNLWKQLEREQTIARPASYLYRIAVRETLRLLREERRHEGEPLEAAEAGPGRTASNGPLVAVERREQAERLARALAALQADRRRAVRAHLAGFEIWETMEMYRWPYQKARNLLARGMADLRDALGGNGR